MKAENQKKFLVGKIADYAENKGWFFGHFKKEELLRSDLVEVAWQDISGKQAAPEDEHFHKQSVEINIVIAGRVNLKINGQAVEVKAGEFYVVYPLATVSEVEAAPETRLIVVRAPSLAGDKFKREDGEV